jgi:hypothetical protein
MRFADSFRAARWVRLINLLLQAVLLPRASSPD